MALSKHGVWVFQDLYSCLSLQTHLSCFLSPALHLTVSHIKLPAVPGTFHAHSQCGMPFFSLSLLCSFLPSKHLLIFQGSAQPSHSLQGYIYWAPTLTPEELTSFLFGLHLHIILSISVWLSWTVSSLKTVYLSRASLYLSVQLINRKISSEWRMDQSKVKATLGAKAKWTLW